MDTEHDEEFSHENETDCFARRLEERYDHFYADEPDDWED